jgi:hypothetical protein
MQFEVKVIGDREVAFYFQKLSTGIKPTALQGLNEIGNYLEKKIKDRFGHYHSSWPKLKRASVIAKYKRRSLGGGKRVKVAVGGDDPLILFGNLKDSIAKEMNDMEVTIFSDNPYAAVHEYGYKQVPARSYMRTTLADEEDNITDIMDRAIGRLI